MCVCVHNGMVCLEAANPKQGRKQMYLKLYPSIFASSILSTSSMHRPRLWLGQLTPHYHSVKQLTSLDMDFLQ